MSERYKVIFEGAATKDFGVVGQLTKNLQNQCHLTTQAVTKMMRLAPLTVKNGVELREAQRYQRALEAMGAKVRIELIDDNGHGNGDDGHRKSVP